MDGGRVFFTRKGRLFLVFAALKALVFSFFLLSFSSLAIAENPTRFSEKQGKAPMEQASRLFFFFFSTPARHGGRFISSPVPLFFFLFLPSLTARGVERWRLTFLFFLLQENKVFHALFELARDTRARAIFFLFSFLLFFS